MDPYFKKAQDKQIFRLLYSLYGAVVVIAWWIRPFFGLWVRKKPHLKNVYGKLFFGDKTEKDLSDSKQIDRCLKNDIGQIAFQVIVVAATIAIPKAMVAYYFIPLITASAVNGYRVVHEHIHELSEDNSPESILNNTLDQPMNGLVRFLFFPRNIGFHRVHHLHPKATYDQLPLIQNWYANHPTRTA